ncbi:Enhancer of mRNA-decapping protein 4 [Striga hermonthica]|uniref:Enhancer of mRNA-decapping protein 4 n=1 Tax=Striga hermonthica TaxID=68872 RepID=A0A9N7NMR8_STRHE|nr:Enhancer of mRNA-decapping protein 4 [Striga hermonthica]
MASPNPPAFDMQKLFNPPPPPSTSLPNSNPNPQNFVAVTNPNMSSAPFPPPSASYPPPTGGAYSFPPQTAPFHYHPVYPAFSNPPQPHQDAHPQRSLSFPTPPLQPQGQSPTAPHHPNFSNPPNPQNPNNHGARLMALLGAPPSTLQVPQQQTSMAMPQIHPTSSSGSDFFLQQNLPSGPGSVISHQSPVMRMPSSKLPKGRHLTGDRLVYDIDVRFPGEVQPQLEVTPITKYGSDPGLVVGRQIAVNKTYICYGLKLGAIRVLNINTALRSLLKGLGQIKIWEDRKSQPVAVLRPHDGLPVNSVTFLAAPHRPDHIILITGGPLNREVKIWVSASEEGWLLPSDAESWRCTQTFELKSSEARAEEAFFNQVVALSQAGLILLANAKRNAIYAVHLEYGPNPEATHMDYIAEFTVTMPILSFTGTSELLPHGDQIVQVYCVQTQAIQQYALDLSQCLPPPLENVVFEKSGSNVSLDAATAPDVEPSSGIPTELSISSSAPKVSIHESGLDGASAVRYPVIHAPAESPMPQEFTSATETKLVTQPEVANDGVSSAASPPLPLSPRLSKTHSGFRSQLSGHGFSTSDRGSDPKIVEYSVDRQMDVHANLSNVASLDGDSRNGDNELFQDEPAAVNQPVKFKHPTHLVTPSEILMANSVSEVSHTVDPRSDTDVNFQDVVVSNDTRNVEMEVKVVGETRFSQSNDMGPPPELKKTEPKEKSFCSQASDPGTEVARECRVLSTEAYTVGEARQFDGTGESETIAQSTTADEVHESVKDVSRQGTDSSTPIPAQQQPSTSVKGQKQKGKSGQGSGPSSPSQSAFNSTDSSTEQGVCLSIPIENAFPQIYSMQEMLNQLVSMQKEMQKQMAAMVAAPVNKEGKRLEAALGRSMEKAVKSNVDALWARIQEENVKEDKAVRERMQQLTNMINNCLNKDLPVIIERTVKRELAALGQSVARTITPTIEKIVSTTIAESFQKGVGDKAVNQLEKSVNSKLEATVARQIQAQFQTSGKQALQETLKSSLETSVIPAFEMSCRAMFEQVDATFKNGLVEHSAAAQQQFDSSHSPLAIALRDAINSASSMTQTLSSEILDGQRKLVALAANTKAANPLISQLSNGPLGGLHDKLEAPLDPTAEISRLVADRKYEEAFTAALQRTDVNIVSWLCAQVDLPGILSMNPVPLSQGVLLSLLQQLACDIIKDTSRKLTWMREVLSAINPSDAMIVVHVRPIFEQVYQILNHHRNLPTCSGAELSNIRLIMHVINSIRAVGHCVHKHTAVALSPWSWGRRLGMNEPRLRAAWATGAWRNVVRPGYRRLSVLANAEPLALLIDRRWQAC